MVKDLCTKQIVGYSFSDKGSQYAPVQNKERLTLANFTESEIAEFVDKEAMQ